MTSHSFDPEVYECECGWIGPEEMLRAETTYYKDPYIQPDLELFCPECNANWEDMRELFVEIITDPENIKEYTHANILAIPRLCDNC